MARVGVVVAMPSELRPLRRLLRGRGDVATVVAGIGTARAAAATARLLDDEAPDRVAVVGICGGVDVPVGALVVPSVVVDGRDGREHRPAPLRTQPSAGGLWTADELTGEADPPWLRARGIVGVDMESAAVLAVCGARGVPCQVVRAVSDPVGTGGADAEVLALSRPDGTADPKAAARYVAADPRRAIHLARLARGASLAASAAASAFVAELGAAG